MKPLNRRRFVEEILPVVPQEDGTLKRQQDTEKPKTWVEIVLHDTQGRSVPDERYCMKLPDGSIQEGRLDKYGKARVEGIEPGTVKVSFPEIERGDWYPA